MEFYPITLSSAFDIYSKHVYLTLVAFQARLPNSAWRAYMKLGFSILAIAFDCQTKSCGKIAQQ